MIPRTISATAQLGSEKNIVGLAPAYVNAFTARATMRPKSASAIVDCTSIVYLARSGSGITSVGLNGGGREGRKRGRHGGGAGSGLMCWVKAKPTGTGRRTRAIGPPLSISQYSIAKERLLPSQTIPPDASSFVGDCVTPVALIRS